MEAGTTSNAKLDRDDRILPSANPPVKESNEGHIMTHTRACAAHAIGCAVENLDGCGTNESAVTVGMDYLNSGLVTCYCNTNMEWAAKWIILGLAALDSEDETYQDWHKGFAPGTVTRPIPCDYCGATATYVMRENATAVITRYVCLTHTQTIPAAFLYSL